MKHRLKMRRTTCLFALAMALLLPSGAWAQAFGGVFTPQGFGAGPNGVFNHQAFGSAYWGVFSHQSFGGGSTGVFNHQSFGNAYSGGFTHQGFGSNYSGGFNHEGFGDDYNGNFPHQGFGEAPLDCGLLVLMALGAGYAVGKRRQKTEVRSKFNYKKRKP